MLAALSEWGELLAALATFILSHAVPAQSPVRRRLISLLGRGVYLLVYSTISFLVLGWLISASARAPYLELWPRQDWQPLVPATGMLVATILAVLGLSTPNPLSIGPRFGRSYDAARPGVVGLVRHPILWATLLWSATHLMPNGDLAHLLLFGLFALVSVGGMVMLDQRKRRLLGNEEWQQLAARTSNLPLASLAKGWRPSLNRGVVLRLAGGGALYFVLVAAHGAITGIPLL